jgi:hypothetical protein
MATELTSPKLNTQATAVQNGTVIGDGNHFSQIDLGNNGQWNGGQYYWYYPFGVPQNPIPQYHYIYQNWPVSDPGLKAQVDKLEKEVLELKELVIALANHLGIGKK